MIGARGRTIAPQVSIIVPAHDEERFIDACLASILQQTAIVNGTARVTVIVVANGCRDATAARARRWIRPAATRDVRLHVIEQAQPGKAEALNTGDARAGSGIRVYHDADVVCAPSMLGRLLAALAGDAPRYASGTLFARAGDRVSHAYARIWTRLPFIAEDVPGCGLYAVNAAGRRRWDAFPPIHSDDKFARLQFAPHERIKVSARYYWPVPIGLRNLIRVRRRWCEGNRELDRVYPVLRRNAGSRRFATNLDFLRALIASPGSAALFALVFAAGKTLALGARPSARIAWRRGR